MSTWVTERFCTDCTNCPSSRTDAHLEAALPGETAQLSTLYTLYALSLSNLKSQSFHKSLTHHTFFVKLQASWTMLPGTSLPSSDNLLLTNTNTVKLPMFHAFNMRQKTLEETWRKILTKPNSLYLRDFPEAIVANIANIAIMSHSHFGQWVIRVSSMLEKSSVKCTSPEPTSANKDETCSNMLFNAR